MNQHVPGSKHPHEHHQPHAHKRGLHRDWRAWLVVALMLGAMALYLMTQDESLGPSGQQERVPAAAGE